METAKKTIVTAFWRRDAKLKSIDGLINATHNDNTMRLLQWALLGLTSIATADSNLTYESRNILSSTFNPPKHFRNVNLVRNINLEKSYPKETVNVVIENIDAKAQSEYFLPVEQGLLGRVGGLEVKDKKDATNTGFHVEVVGIDPARYASHLLRPYILSHANAYIAPPSSTRSLSQKPSNPRSSRRSPLPTSFLPHSSLCPRRSSRTTSSMSCTSSLPTHQAPTRPSSRRRSLSCRPLTCLMP